jgi:hypothetical protein
MAKGEDTAGHPNRQVGRDRMRAILGVTYTRQELREAAFHGQVNSALGHGSSMPRNQMTLGERLRDPDD